MQRQRPRSSSADCAGPAFTAELSDASEKHYESLGATSPVIGFCNFIMIEHALSMIRRRSQGRSFDCVARRALTCPTHGTQVSVPHTNNTYTSLDAPKTPSCLKLTKISQA